MAEIHYYDRKLETIPLTKKNLNRVRGKKLWIDLQRPTDKEIELIRRKFKIHPTTIEDIKSQPSDQNGEPAKNKQGTVIPFKKP